MPPEAAGPLGIVAVIDDDADVREALGGLFRSVGLDVELFRSVQEFRASPGRDGFGCLVLDVRLPGTSGLDFQSELQQADRQVPIVFISGHADVAMSVRAMKAGAVEFLTKPVRDQDLLDAVQAALTSHEAKRAEERGKGRVAADYATLTLREREVLELVVSGRRNKWIAAELGVSEATVKLHRGHIMQKMGANSLVDLVRIADLLSGRPNLYQRREELPEQVHRRAIR